MSEPELKASLPSTTFAERVEKSSQIASIDYDATNRELIVVYRGSPAWMYVYLDVPAHMWGRVQGAPSIGSFVHREIKAQFKFEKRPIVQAGTPAP